MKKMKAILISIFVVVVASAIQYYFWPYIEPAPSLLYYPVIILCCLIGDGITAIILSAAIMQYLFIPPYDSIGIVWPSDFVRLFLFTVCAFSIKLLVDRLKTTIRKLEETRKSREHFISTLTHDLRTPLTAAKLKADIISRISEDENIRKQSSRITANLTRADKLIQNILDVSRIKEGQKVLLALKDSDLTKLLRHCIEELTIIHLRKHQILFQTRVHPGASR